MRRLFMLMVTLTLLSLTVNAQSEKHYNVTGRVLDSETGESLMQCTVALMSQDTTKLVGGVVTSQDGSFTLKNVNKGSYVVKISYVGYHNFFHKVIVTDEASSHKVGTILLVPSSVELNSAVVTAQLKEVEVKDDTIMFNAAAFKVAEGSVLEELIRKLPGVVVEDDGTIKVNGKTVSKILVEGKEFFSNNKNMAMKNLPTEIIDKIKTYDKQSELSRITGIDDGDEETVIDLTIKKGMKKGWFGNVDLSYGSRERYSEKIMANRFQDDLQASFIGSLNNVNDQTGGGGGRGGNNGVTTSGMAGARLVFDLDNFEFGGNVQYSGNKNVAITNSSSQNFVSTEKASFSNRLSNNLTRKKDFSGNFKMEWKVDSLTTIMFRPNVSVGKNDSENFGRSMSFNDNPYADDGVTNPLVQYYLIRDSIKVNESESQSWSNGDSYNVDGELIVNRKLGGNPWFGDTSDKKKSGRNVSLRLKGVLGDTKRDNSTYSSTIYHQKGDSTDVTCRYRNTPSYNRSYTVGMTYSEPILRNLFAQVNYSYNYSKRHSDGKTYDFGAVDSIGVEIWERYGQFGLLAPDYMDFLSDSLSRYTDNINYTHNIEISFRYITSILNLSVGVKMERQTQDMVYQYQGLDTVASRSFGRLSPTLNAKFRFDKQHTLKVSYRGSSRQPDMTDLFNLTDNSNPLNIKEGNPDLKPSFTNNVSADYNKYFVKTSQALFGRLSFSNTFNGITNRTEYNAITGGQVTRPENIDGNWNVNCNIGFNTPLFIDKLTFNTNTSGSYRNNVGYIYQNKSTLKNTVKHSTLGESLSLALRLSDIDVRANGSITWDRSSSDLVTANNQNTVRFHYGLSSTGNFNNGFGFSTDISMSSRRGYSSSSMNTNELIWNAQVSYRFLKGRAATISINAFDILHQRSNISRQISEYSRSDTESNSINSYFLCHFIYRLNLFGSREVRKNMREHMRFERGGDRMDDSGERRFRGGGRLEGGGRSFGGSRGGF